MMRAERLESEKGICLVDPFADGGEYTVCGLAVDFSLDDESFTFFHSAGLPPAFFKSTTRKTITCPDCIERVRFFRDKSIRLARVV